MTPRANEMIKNLKSFHRFVVPLSAILRAHIRPAESVGMKRMYARMNVAALCCFYDLLLRS